VVFEIVGEGLDTWDTLSESYDIFSDIMKAYKAIKFMKSLKHAGWSASVKGSKSWFKLFKSSYQQISKVKSAAKVSMASKVLSRIGTAIEIVGILVEIGFTAYTLYAIFDCADWDPMTLNMALLKTLMEFTFTVILINIGFIPIIGWLIALVIGISDMIGGWSDDLFEWLISVMSKIKSEVTPDVKVIGEPELSIDDKDGNGLDVGDRITYRSQLQAIVFGTDWRDVYKSDLFIDINAVRQLFGRRQSDGNGPEGAVCHKIIVADTFPVIIAHESIQGGESTDAQHEDVRCLPRSHGNFLQGLSLFLFCLELISFQQQRLQLSLFSVRRY